MATGLWEIWEQANYPDIIAYSLNTEQSHTFQDLTRLVIKESKALDKLPRGSVIALSELNSTRWLARFLAIQKHHCCALLLDSDLNESSAQQEALDLECSHLWSDQLIEIDTTAPRLPDISLIKLTSGTSGKPKRILCTADQIITDGKQCISTMDIRPSDRQLGTLPFGHSYALGNLILPLILQGSPLYYCADFTATQAASWIKIHQLSIYPTIPTIVKLLAESPSIKSLHPLRTLISAGAPLPKDYAQVFHHKFKIYVHNFYGSSETGGICYDRIGEAGISGQSVGTPLDGVTVSITEHGQISVYSQAVTTGNGEYVLEDFGELSEKNELRITGRLEDWINTGGKKIRPQEITSKIMTLPGVTDAWTGKVIYGSREWAKAVVTGDTDAETLRKQLSEIFPQWKVPREIRVIESLPRTTRGKLDRKRLANL